MPTAAYIHIPFCRRRCFYCDFPISVLGDRKRGETSGAMATYVQHLCAEIQATPSAGPALETVFFGGGTPSLLSPEQLAQILATVRSQFGLAPGAEISMEMDPGTFTFAHLQAFQALGVNRISLGIQSFQDQLLAACGRVHRVTHIETALADLHRAGIENFSLDLISGLPHQTMTDWQHSLARAIAADPPHLSTYDLVVEPTTVFGQRYQPGAAPLPPENTAADMYREASEQLRAAGYEHYEISNYAKPHHRCRHNQVYWHNAPYYGFGMGATSYLKGCRFQRPRTRHAYFDWLAPYISSGGQIDSPRDTDEDQLLETLMLGLRLTAGISWQQLVERFGAHIVEPMVVALRPHVDAGYVTIGNPQALLGQVQLTDPQGLLVSNTVIVDLWDALTT